MLDLRLAGTLMLLVGWITGELAEPVFEAAAAMEDAAMEDSEEARETGRVMVQGQSVTVRVVA